MSGQPPRPYQPQPYRPHRAGKAAGEYLRSQGLPDTTHSLRQPQPQPRPRPRRMVTTRPMGAGAEVFHWTMILCTGGLWVPVYLAARRARKTITTWE